jgi:hypothetical protein
MVFRKNIFGSMTDTSGVSIRVSSNLKFENIFQWTSRCHRQIKKDFEMCVLWNVRIVIMPWRQTFVLINGVNIVIHVATHKCLRKRRAKKDKMFHFANHSLRCHDYVRVYPLHALKRSVSFNWHQHIDSVIHLT